VHDHGYFGEPVAARYDESSAEKFDPAVVEPVVDVLARLAGDGRALELGIGTGRIALPLARRGVPVHGIELSEAMVARLRAKPGGADVGVTVGDFARRTARVFHLSEDPWGIDVYDVARQGLVSHHFETVDGRVQHVAMPFRYTWPGELDLMAQLAGMELRERWSGWRREPFASDSRAHVSVWEMPRD